MPAQIFDSESEWVYSTIDETCIIEYGTRVTRKRDAGTIYPVYGGGGATFQMDSYNREDRMVVSRFAISETSTRFVEGKFFLNDSGLTLRPKDDLVILPNFLDWLVHSLNDKIYSLGRGTAQKNLNMDEFRKLSIHYPKDISEQQRIVSILDEAFKVISVNSKINSEKFSKVGTLFDSYLDSVFTNEKQRSSAFSLGEICHFENGDRGKNYPNRAEYVDAGIPWINTGHILPNGTLDKYSMNYISEEKFQSLRSGKTKLGDLVYCLRGATLGKTAIVDSDSIGAVASSLVIIRPSEKILSKFLYFFLISRSGKSFIKQYQNGAAQPNLGAKSVKKFIIPLPSLELQTQITNEIERCYDHYNEVLSLCDKSSRTIFELRQSILQEAFNGTL